MNKADIVDRVAEGTGLTKLETEAVVNGFVATVMAAVQRGERVELRGFGTFHAKERAARTGRNIRTGEAVEIAARHVPAFRPAREFRDGVEDAFRDDS